MSRLLTGVVTSDKANKTIVISVRARKTHPIYQKQYTINTKFMAHDEANQAKVGDLVTIIETRPQSARKRFKLDKIIERSGTRFEETDATADVPEPEIEQPIQAPAKEAKQAKEKK
jgi:small subunit ribosomal protein S17